MADLKVGIIGAGGITDYHINGYLKAGADVTAISDTQIERAKVQAKKFNIPKYFSSYEEMFKKTPEIDAVSVCVPNKFHAFVSIDCLKMGKHVFCEKPPALNANETIQMVNTAKDSNRILMFDFNNRARPESQVLMKYIKEGVVGKINSAQALWIRRCGIPGFGGWFTQKNLSGGGPVIDLLHMIDLSLYFMKFPQPRWVLASIFNDFSTNPEFKGPWGIPDVKDGKMDVETAAHAFVRFEGGEVLFIRNSWAEMNKREEVSVTFQGTKAGGLIKRIFKRDGIDETAIDECELYTQENRCPVNRKIIVEPDEKMGRERAVINFVNTILKKEEPFSRAEEAIILMKIIDAVYLSAEKGVSVEID
ncbi:MAG: Gfo/Idh/MocA family oxidoreductase [Candidatus Omnitrophica bacterium]|nr:Gfo/Idh/MocA family oxidoreductase [Candidatus Omnitrophota bacterium]